MCPGTGPEPTQASTPTKVPMALALQKTLPSGGTATFVVESELESVLEDFAAKATGPAVIRIRRTETPESDVQTIRLPDQSFQDYLEEELPIHLSALVGEEQTEWERKNATLLAEADAGDDEAFFALLARDPRHLKSEQTLRRVLTWRTEVDHYYRMYDFKASRFWTGAEDRAEAQQRMEHAKESLRRLGQCQLTLSDHRGKRPLPPAGQVRGIYYGLLCLLQGLHTRYKDYEKTYANAAQCEELLAKFVRGLQTLRGDSLFLPYVVVASHLITEPEVLNLTAESATPLSQLSGGRDLTPSDTARALTAAAFDVSEASIERLCAELAPIPLPSTEEEECWFVGRPEFALLDFPEVQALLLTLSR
ncbi:MAG: hypothetical protein ABI980_15035 [Nitrospirota bacterium]